MLFDLLSRCVYSYIYIYRFIFIYIYMYILSNYVFKRELRCSSFMRGDSSGNDAASSGSGGDLAFIQKVENFVL